MRSSWYVVLLAACGGGSSDSLDVKLANTAVAAVRTGDSWQSVERDAAGNAKVELDGPTTLAIVCDDVANGYFNYYTLYLGPGMRDDEPLDLSCRTILADIEVTIAAPMTTEVSIGFMRSFNGNALHVEAGTYDVIAIDRSMTPPRFEIRRDVALTANTTLTFSLATTGTPMVATRIEATPGAGEALSRNTRLVTKNRTFAFSSAPDGAGWSFPASALQAGDRQSAGASTTSETLGTRSASRSIDGEATVALDLPAYLTTVTPGATSATWAGGADWNSFYYGINNADFSVLWDATVYEEWTEAGGEVDTIAFPDPADLPGWLSRWNLGTTTGYDWYFSASRTTETSYAGATRTGTL